MIRVGVLGAAGRMGATVCEAVANESDMELVAVADAQAAGQPLSPFVGAGVPDLTIAPSVDALTAAGVDVVVDFTLAAAARTNLPLLAEAGVHAVVGTSGFGPEDFVNFQAAFTKSNCLVVPNFAISAVLMMRFAELAAPFFETGEIVEYHHMNKVDAPSGTAMSTARRMAAANSNWAPDPTQNEVVPGARGGEGPGGVRVHAVRMKGMVAHQEVILGAVGQTLTIRDDSYDRQSYMPGVVLAVRKIADLPGFTQGLDTVMGI